MKYKPGDVIKHIGFPHGLLLIVKCNPDSHRGYLAFAEQSISRWMLQWLLTDYIEVLDLFEKVDSEKQIEIAKRKYKEYQLMEIIEK